MADCIRRHARQQPERTALIYLDRHTSYGDLHDHSSRVANALVGETIGTEGRIALLANNSDLFYELFFGATKAGVVLTPVNFRLAAAEVAYILNDAGAEILFVGKDYYALVEQIAAEVGAIRTIIALDGGHSHWPDYMAWRDVQTDHDPVLEGDTNDTAIQVYSSGTTGHPKGIELTHANWVAELEALAAIPPAWMDDEISMVVMPLFHVAGSVWGGLGLYQGATNVVMPAVEPEKILHGLGEYGVTRVLFVPAVIQTLLQQPVCASTDFSTLRQIFYGASPFPLPVLERALEIMGARLIGLYGLTETTGPVTYLGAEEHVGERMRSCGKPLPGTQIRVVDANGGDCRPGEVGEIVANGPLIMKGYWNRAEATLESIRDGWFYTGDAGYWDEDGYLYIHDRLKDMIISGGENVYPAEVEAVCAAHPAVVDVAVIGVPDERWGETVKAVVVVKTGETLTAPGLIDFARERIAHFKCPTSVDFVDEIPRNPSGKILKRVLREPHWQGKRRRVN